MFKSSYVLLEHLDPLIIHAYSEWTSLNSTTLVSIHCLKTSNPRKESKPWIKFFWIVRRNLPCIRIKFRSFSSIGALAYVAYKYFTIQVLFSYCKVSYAGLYRNCSQLWPQMVCINQFLILLLQFFLNTLWIKVRNNLSSYM